MKRLAFALAAAVLGAGCHPSNPPPPPSGTLDLGWSFVRTLNQAGSPTVSYHCNTTGLGIDTVVVEAVGAGSLALPCADNAGDGGAVELAPGTYSIVVTAYRGGTGGVALFSSRFDNVNIFVNAITQLQAPLDATFAPLQVNVNFQNLAGTTSFPTCASAGVTQYPLFELIDSAGTTVYSAANFSCTDPPGLTFNATSPAGPVDLDTYTIRVEATNFPTVPTFDFDTAVSPNCSLLPQFHHFGNDTANVPVYDVSGLTLCP